MGNQQATQNTTTNDYEVVKWFAMKASKKETLAISTFKEAGLRVYCPTYKATVMQRGDKIVVDRLLIPNTIFVYGNYRTINALKYHHPFITYSYRKVDGSYKILTIPVNEMERFIQSADKMHDDITYYRPEEVYLHRGDRVRIIGGAFDGYEGTLVKDKDSKQKMFLIDFKMLGAIATHISPKYIQLIK